MGDDLKGAEDSKTENILAEATVHMPMLWSAHGLLLDQVSLKFWPCSPWLLCCVISCDLENWNDNKTVSLETKHFIVLSQCKGPREQTNKGLIWVYNLTFKKSAWSFYFHVL